MSVHPGLAEAPAQTNAGRWAWHLGALGIIIGLMLAMFPFEIASALEVWWIYPAYSHCYLIIPISAWLVWRKRAELAPMVPAIAPKALMIFPVLIIAWLAGVFATINELRQFSLVAMIIAAILTIFGPKVFRVVAFPALYLFFLVPFGQYFIPPMQDFTTRFTDVGLSLLGVPHFTQGTIIELPNGRFEIADACAGLRFLTAALALCAFFAQITYTNWRKSAALMIGCVIVPLIANGLRCIGTMALAYWTNDFETVAANHITAGFVFNTIIILLMFWIGNLFRDRPEKPVPVQSEFRTVNPAGPFAMAALIVLLTATGPVFAYWQEERPVATGNSALLFPQLSGGWTLLPPTDAWDPYFPAPDQKLDNRIVPPTGGAPAVDMKVFYYSRIQKKTSLISSKNALWNGGNWHGFESHSLTANVGDRLVRFNENIVSNISGSSENRLIWSCYWLNGQFTSSALRVKLLQLKGIATRNEGSALIAISTTIDGPTDEARARLRAALAMMKDLPNKLDTAEHAKELPIASN
jgi:exosortase A